MNEIESLNLLFNNFFKQSVEDNKLSFDEDKEIKLLQNELLNISGSMVKDQKVKKIVMLI